MSRSRPVRTSAIVAVSAAILLALASCAPEPGPGTSTPPVSVSPAPTASEAADIPVVAFDGDCGSVLTADALSGALGQTMNVWEPTWQDGADAQLGGVRCGWTSEKYLSASVVVWVYPVDVLDTTYVEGDASNSCAVEGPSCVTSAVFGDAWVGIRVTSESAQTLVETLTPLRDDIGARLADQDAPRADVREGWWGPVPTCADLAAGVAEHGVTMTVKGDYPVDAPVFVGGPLVRGCWVSATVDGTSFDTQLSLRAGAGDGVENVISQNADAAVDVDGRTFATAVEQFPIDGASGLLLGSDGVNLVEMTLNSDVVSDQEPPVLAAVLDALAG